MFQFSPLASSGLCIHPRMTGLNAPPGFPIRAFPDRSLRAAPRDFSQLTTPFLAGPCPGIHRAPFSRLTGTLFGARPTSLAFLPSSFLTPPPQPNLTAVLRHYPPPALPS
jgi:hypothetical protein